MADLFGSPEWQKLADDNPKEYYENTPFVRSLWEGRLPTWLGQAYEQDISPAIEAAPSPTTMEGALTYGKGAYNLAKGLVTGAVDTIDSAQKDPTNPKKMLDLSLMVSGAGGLLGRVPAGSGKVLGANVFQGGPHKYGPEGAAKSLDHMGKGEGATAYGWGRYDADAEGVARDYQKTLSGNWDDSTRVANAVYDALGPLSDGSVLFKGGKFSKDDFLKKFGPTIADDWVNLPPGLRTAAEKRLEGYLYKHDLPDEDIARYLDWDAPLSEQTQAVQDIAARFGIKTTPSGMKEARGSDIYRAIGHAEQKPPFDTGSMNPGSREGSEALRKAGIPGLKYYDGMSRKKNLMIDGVAASRGVEMDAADYVRLWGPDRIERIKIEINGERGLKKKKELIAAVEDIVHNNKAVTEEMSGTRNYVTWDQEVLNRMKLLERNGESMIDALR